MFNRTVAIDLSCKIYRSKPYKNSKTLVDSRHSDKNASFNIEDHPQRGFQPEPVRDKIYEIKKNKLLTQYH